MTSPLPQVRLLTALGTFLKLTQDFANTDQGLSRAGSVLPTPLSRIKADVHVTNLGDKSVKLTLRSLAATTKVGSSRVVTVVPQQLVTISFDDWFDSIEFLAEGVGESDGITSIMVRGDSTVPFSFFTYPSDPRSGLISSSTPPNEYPHTTPPT